MFLTKKTAEPNNVTNIFFLFFYFQLLYYTFTPHAPSATKKIKSNK